MDPIMKAACQFAEGACAFLRSKRARSLRIVAAPENHAHVISTLRLIERAADNHRPFFLYAEPFTTTEAYFAGLLAKIAADYEQVRGVDLPALRLPREGDAMRRAALVVARVAELLGDVLIGLVPPHAADAPAFRAALRAWIGLPFPIGVKLAIPDVGLGDGEARFIMDRRAISAFIASSTPEAPALRARLTKAALDGDFHKVLEMCKADELADAAKLASSGAALAAGDREAARIGFAEAAALAERAQDPSGAARAWQAVAVLADLDGLDGIAATARAKAEQAGDAAGVPALLARVAQLRR